MSELEPESTARDAVAAESSRGALASPSTGLLDACVVDALPEDVRIPPECACCGALASGSLALAPHFDARALAVPYCSSCRAHALRDGTRRRAVAASAALLAVTFGAGLPLVWQPPSAVLYVALVVFATFAPALVARALPRPRRSGHAAAGRAVWWRPSGALACASRSWAEALAGPAGATATFLRTREPVGSRALVAVVLGAALGTPFLYRLHFPVVHVVNATERTLTLLVDGRPYLRVPPTGSESPHGRTAFRVPAGRRLFTARDESGRSIDTVAQVLAGQEHLYAPGSEGTCFWIETTGYGQSGGSGTEREPLGGQSGFWALPSGIDLWFVSTPAPAEDGRSTGGVLRALRRGRCENAPETVRPLAPPAGGADGRRLQPGQTDYSRPP